MLPVLGEAAARGRAHGGEAVHPAVPQRNVAEPRPCPPGLGALLRRTLHRWGQQPVGDVSRVAGTGSFGPGQAPHHAPDAVRADQHVARFAPAGMRDDDTAAPLLDAGHLDAGAHDIGRYGVPEHLEQLGPGEQNDVTEPS